MKPEHTSRGHELQLMPPRQDAQAPAKRWGQDSRVSKNFWSKCLQPTSYGAVSASPDGAALESRLTGKEAPAYAYAHYPHQVEDPSRSEALT